MDRRTFIAAGTTSVFGAMLFGASQSSADAGSLSVRATPGGPLITPSDKFFVYSQMRNPDKVPAGIAHRRPGQHAGALQPRRSRQEFRRSRNS